MVLNYLEFYIKYQGADNDIQFDIQFVVFGKIFCARKNTLDNFNFN